MVWHHLLPHRTEARSGVHDHQGLRRRVDFRRLKLLDGVTRLLQGLGSPSNTVLHLRRGSLAGRVEHHSDSDRLGWFGPPKRRGHRPRVSPGWPDQDIERPPEVRNPPRQRTVDLRQLHTDRCYVRGLDRACVWDASQGGLECADPTALRWMAERSEAVIPKTQRTHAGRYSGSLARA
jgi:hypothetical protein